ncbi:MAG TPA: neutral zinc metallopeptidase, partial [Longimicrobiaceae bacterium]
MRFGNGGRSSDLEDNRGSSGGFGGGRTVGIGGSAVLLVLSLLFGRNLFQDTGVTPSVGAGGARGGAGMSASDSAREEPEVQFVSAVIDDAQATWDKLLPQYGKQYHHAKLRLYRDAERTGCGTGQSAMGPFYCPLDERVYLDLGFFDELQSKFGAPGQFAQAYVIAHELGHHVQHVLGTDEKMRQAQQRNPDAANQLSVALELQADCYAGVWGHSVQQRNLLEPGEMQQGLAAASSVGDDRLTQGRVSPDNFTHGTSDQ